MWPSHTLWQHITGSILAQVKACCLAAPNHYLNQYWLIISKVQFMYNLGTILVNGSHLIFYYIYLITVLLVSIYQCPKINMSTYKGLLGHDDIIKSKHFPRYWHFVPGIHRSSVNSLHTGKWRRALMFSLISVCISGWVNNCEAGDLRCHCAHYDVTVM